MRVNTPERLVVENRPLLASVVIAVIAFAFVAAGLFMLPNDPLRGGVLLAIGTLSGGYFLWGTARRESLILDRRSGQGAITRRSLTGRADLAFPLSDLTHATLDKRDLADGSAAARVILIVKGQDVPLTATRSTLPGQKGAVDHINAWLRGTP